MVSPFPSRLLLDWFRRNQRPLPWRKDYSPYHVWVSEIMSQQTRIEQMLPYYDRFLSQFPTLKSLADASPEKVLKSWEGLGYYSRARNFHAAARQVVNEHGGIIPSTKEELVQLRGFGSYISSAVASIAFNEDVCVVDGNVLRVASRYWGIKEDVSKPATRKKMESLLQGALPPGSAREFNQGMMELGALVCTPVSPSCGECPLKKGCFAFIHSQQDYFPVKEKKKKPSTKHFAMLVLVKDGKYDLVQRTTQLLNGMWEFPMVEYSPLHDSTHSIEKKAAALGYSIRLKEEVGLVSHAYSHLPKRPICTAWSILPPSPWSGFPLPT